MMYIKGETDQLPVNDNPLPNDVKDIFYLMADFNFKNKTWVNTLLEFLSINKIIVYIIILYFRVKLFDIIYLIFVIT